MSDNTVRGSPFYRRSTLYSAHRIGAALAIRKTLFPKEETDSMRLGTVVHAFALEGKPVPDELIMPDAQDRRKKGDVCFSRAVSEILPDLCIGAFWAVESVKSLRDDITVWECEHTLTRDHDGRRFFGRADAIGFSDGEAAAMIDLKITGGIDPRAFKNACYEFGYWHQACFYTWLSQAEHIDWYTVCVSTEPPHDACVYHCEFTADELDADVSCSGPSVAVSELLDAAEAIDRALESPLITRADTQHISVLPFEGITVSIDMPII